MPARHWVFGGLLLFATLIAFSNEIKFSVISIVAVLILWYLIGAYFGVRFRQKSPFFVVVYFVAGWLLWYVAAAIDAVFFVLLFMFFPYIFMVVPLRLSIVLSLILNMLVFLALNRMNSDMADTWMLFIGLASIGSCLMGYFVYDVIRQSQERQRLIAELEATREHLVQTQREAGILSERHRLAGELHDTLAQGLIGIITHLEAAENPADTQKSRHHLQQAKQMARDNLQETRRFIWAMRPAALENQVFDKGLQRILESWSKASGSAADFVMTGNAYPLAPEHELTILRLTQEALANITRHAKAAHTTVTLSYMPDGIVLDINDDGCGFNVAQANGHGFGLNNMRYRVEQLGGTLAVESTTGEGTTVSAYLPVKEC